MYFHLLRHLVFDLFVFSLRWAQSRHKELKVRGSSLEFRLHKLKFLDLLREGHHREALQYSKHFARFASDHTKGGINCMVNFTVLKNSNGLKRLLHKIVTQVL